MKIFIFIILGIIIVCLIIYLNDIINNDNKRIQKIKNAAMQQKLLTLEKQYGKRGRFFDKEGFHVWVYNETKTVIVYLWSFEKRMVFSFDDIISCSLTSNTGNSKIFVPAQSETTFSTKTSGKSLVGRSIVGAVIAGPVGAIIGGMSANKKTVSVTTTIPEKTVQIQTTSHCAVIHVLKNGIEDNIPCYGDGVDIVKSLIDEIISVRVLEK